MSKVATAFVSGALFAIGLAVSGMTNPHHVVAFLDLAGAWNPSLLFVMAGAIAVYAPVYWLSKRHLSAKGVAIHGSPGNIDARLVVGSALFGVGWGLAGYCPGPALTSMGSGATEAITFCVAMVIGFWLVRRLDERRDLDASRA